MKVRELIEQLNTFNQDATVDAVVFCRKEEFSLAWSSNGGEESPETITQQSKAKCDSVSFYVDRLCTNEQLKKSIEHVK